MTKDHNSCTESTTASVTVAKRSLEGSWGRSVEKKTGLALHKPQNISTQLLISVVN